MSPTIDLIRVTSPSSDDWNFGTVTLAHPSIASIDQGLAESATRRPDAILVLDGALAPPGPDLLERLLAGSGDIWHGGLVLGNASRPAEIDYVTPTWMLNLDPDPTIEATSWRLSLRCCLLRPTVVEQLGGPHTGFDTLAGAALDLGLHAIRSGAIVRHIPGLVVGTAPADGAPTPDDGLRIIARHHGRRWLWWAAGRRIRHTGHLLGTARAVHRCRATTDELARTRPFTHPVDTTSFEPASGHDQVTVLVPTIDRYPYLRTLLEQLAEQTVRPLEVIVVDQTPTARRIDDIAGWAPDLPVSVLTLDAPGQCTSRNTGLLAASGPFVLFLDDDDEVGPTLIEQHLRILAAPDIAASSGGVDDVGSGPPPYDFTFARVGDVFPTNNTLLRYEALIGSSLFDPAFDRGARADHDLGTRLYLAGALLRFDPEVRLIHHHAPQGGLRTHGARVVTRASSRRSLTERNLTTPTEVYLGRKYFSDEQTAEARAISVLSLFGYDGAFGRRLLRAIVQLVLLPDSIHKMHEHNRVADAMLRDRVATPELPPGRVA